MTTMKQHVLEITRVRKSFGSVHALTGVSLTIDQGEVVALVGDNGAGKSTLVKIVAGVLTPDEGEIRLDGNLHRFNNPSEASHAGVETVYQDLALAENLDAVANLFLGRELKRGLSLDEPAMEAQTLKILKTLGARISNVRVPVAGMSGGQRQAVAIAKGLISRPRLIQLDEPTAALGVSQSRHVLDLIRRLRDDGMAVLVISHNLVDVLEIADYIVVLRLGQVAKTFCKGEAGSDDIVAAITGVYRENGASKNDDRAIDEHYLPQMVES